jgi:hypothetical protein
MTLLLWGAEDGRGGPSTTNKSLLSKNKNTKKKKKRKKKTKNKIEEGRGRVQAEEWGLVVVKTGSPWLFSFEEEVDGCHNLLSKNKNTKKKRKKRKEKKIEWRPRKGSLPSEGRGGSSSSRLGLMILRFCGAEKELDGCGVPSTTNKSLLSKNKNTKNKNKKNKIERVWRLVVSRLGPMALRLERRRSWMGKGSPSFFSIIFFPHENSHQF